MKRGALIAGLLSGALCAGCIFAYSVQVREEADDARIEAMQRYGGEQVDVLVAAKDIYPGEVVDASNAEVKTWLSDLLPSDCVTSFEDVKGMQAASLIISGEAVSQRRFDSAGSGIDVPQGCVALSVPAEDVQAVGGVLSAGDVVDVYATGSQTSCIGRRISVLATNVEHSNGVKGKVSWVTLAVPLELSQEFVTASQSMDIYFALPAPEIDRQSSDQSQNEKQDDPSSSGLREG
jgi:pilus assembly protein CpaB